jgi:hypothetical protein
MSQLNFNKGEPLGDVVRFIVEYFKIASIEHSTRSPLYLKAAGREAGGFNMAHNGHDVLN